MRGGILAFGQREAESELCWKNGARLLQGWGRTLNPARGINSGKSRCPWLPLLKQAFWTCLWQRGRKCVRH